MPKLLRSSALVVLLILVAATWENVQAQCIGLPTVTSIFSEKNPEAICSPVRARVSYRVNFLSNVPSGTIDIVINWGDGTSDILPQVTGGNLYQFANLSHDFPADSDCEYLVTMGIRYNGQFCPSTRQIQKVASWRTDEFNGGDVRLISPVTGTNEHLVCQGEPVDVIFNDLTNFNCNAAYIANPPQAIETPNIEKRWQQIEYNVVSGANIIPNVTLINPLNPSVPLTDASGNAIVSNLQDPRGVEYMPAPVVLNDPRRRAALQLTAPGGFGPAFPQVGDVFEIRIKYWNFCNPYSNNGAAPMAPVNGDLVNGDNPPVIAIARIRIVAAPAAPTGGDQTVCNGTTPSDFQANGVPGGNLVQFYTDAAGAPGTLIRSTTNNRLRVNEHPDWAGSNNIGRTYSVWVSHRANVAGSCESPKIRLTRTIRARPDVPVPTIGPPTEICNRDGVNNYNEFMITLPPADPENPGGATQYVWNTNLQSGLSLQSSTATTATYRVNVSFSPGQVYMDRNFTITRRFTSNPQCGRNQQFTVRVFNTAIGGTVSTVPDVCETTPVGTMTLSGHRGEILRWEVSQNNGTSWSTYTGPASGNAITPGLLTNGVYQFRAIVASSTSFTNGLCGPVPSSVTEVEVFDNPAPATVGPNQAQCTQLSSDPLGGSDPGTGTGSWSFISSLPTGLNPPTYSGGDPTNRNTIITVDAPGAYRMRWTVRNGICQSTADIVVDFGGTPTTPNAGADRAICGPNTTLQGNQPTVGTGAWTQISGPGTANILDPAARNSQVVLDGSPPSFGTYQFEWRISTGTQGNICATLGDIVELTFFEPANATVADVGPICIGPGPAFAPIDISGTVSGGVEPDPNGGTWANVSGNGSVSATVFDAGNYRATYTPDANDYNLGAPIRVKLIANPIAAPLASPCAPVEREILINIDRTPLSNGGLDIPAVCTSEAQLQAATPAFGATGVWTGPPGVSFDDPSSPSTTVRGLGMGTTSLTWTVTSSSGLCVGAGDPVSVTRVAPPSPVDYTSLECEVVPAGGPVVTSVILNNFVDGFGAGIPGAGNRTVTWYRNAPPPIGTLVNSPNLPITNIGSGTVFVARIQDNTTNCSSDGAVTINVRPLPPAIDAIISTCETDPVNAPGVAVGIDLSTSTYIDPVTGSPGNVDVRWYDTFANAVTGAAAGEITAPFDVTNSRTVHARVIYNDALPSCPDFAEVKLQVNSLPNVTTITGDQTVCMGAQGVSVDQLPIVTYQVPSLPGAKYTWDIPQGAGEFAVFGGGGTNDFFALIKFPFTANPPVLEIKVTIDFNGCTTNTFTLPITRSAIPTAPVIAGPADVCEESDAIQFNIVAPNPGVDYVWEINRQSDNSSGGAFVVSGQNTANILVNFQAENVFINVRESSSTNSDCSAPATPYPVTINRLPAMTILPPVIVCSGTPAGITFTADAGSPATIDYYDITAVNVPPQLSVVTAPAAPLPGVGLPANVLQGAVYRNTTETPHRATFVVSPVNEVTLPAPATALKCFGPSQIVTLDVNPEPVLASLSKDVCSEEPTGITLTTQPNSFSADQFVITSIEQTTNPGNPLIRPAGVTAPQLNQIVNSAAIFNDAWINNGAPARSGSTFFQVTYLVAARNSVTGCQGSPALPVVVRVFPKPDILPRTETRCSGPLNATMETLNVDNALTSFTWAIQSLSPNLGGAQAQDVPVNGNTVLINNNLSNNDGNSGTVVYNVRAQFSTGTISCARNAALTVNVGPVPPAIDQPVRQVCSDAPNNGGVAVVDLTSIQSAIIPPANGTIQWFVTDPATDPAAAVVATPATFSAQHNVPVFARVTSTDAFGCQKTVPVRYDISNAVSLAPLDVTNVTCNGANNGRITATVAAGTGTAPFFFRVRNNDPFSGTNVFGGLAPGIAYDVTVQDSRGCLSTLTTPVILEPTQVTATLALQDVECFSDPNGTNKDRNGRITVTPGGGSGNYSYILFPGGISQTSTDFPNLRPGAYTVRVLDIGPDVNNPVANCYIEVPTVLNQPSPVDIVSVTIPQDAQGRQISCNGATNGTINVTAGGGTGPYNFFLTPFANNPVAGAATAQFTGLSAGTYSVRVEDSRGCPSVITRTSILDVPALLPGTIGSSQNVCLNQNDAFGNAQPFTELVQPFGGAGTYEYIWQSSTDQTNWFPTGTTTATFDPDASGAFTQTGVTYYRRLIRDQLSTLPNPNAFCLDYKGQNNVVTVTVRPQPSIDVFWPAELCAGENGEIRVAVTSGTLPVEFNYDDGAGNLLPDERSNQAMFSYPVNNFTTARTFRFFQITDAFNCAAPDFTQTINVRNVSANFTIDNPVKCPGQPFTFTVPVQPDVDYRWTLGDGTVRIIDPANAAEYPSFTHTYSRTASVQGDANFNVTLEVIYNSGCRPRSTQTVTVRRAVVVDIVQPRNEICSGEQLTYEDNSTGVTGGRWFYTITGVAGETNFETAGTPLVNFSPANTGPTNPLEYNVFYEPIGQPGCPELPVALRTINVYMQPDANFTASPPNPSVVNGLAETVIDNISTPLNHPDFVPRWDWDDNNPILTNLDPQGNSIRVGYDTESPKKIVLVLINAKNSFCSDRHEIDIVPFLGPPNVDFRATRAACFPLNLDVQNLSSGLTEFRWTLTSDNGTNEVSNLRQPDFRIINPGIYTLTLTARRGGQSYGPLSKVIEVFDIPIADFNLRQGRFFLNEEVKPVNLSRFASAYTWDMGDGTIYEEFEPRHKYTLEGTEQIQLTAMFNHGLKDADDDPATPDIEVVCQHTASLPVVIVAGGALKIPNAFTPSVNGPSGGVPDNNFTNDVFLPIMEGVEEFSMHIFDRWGNLLFESRDKNIGWDGYDRNGRLMPAGVYVYKIVLRLGDGQRTTKVGDVTLIR